MAAASLCGCATDGVLKAELQELTASVRALRAENARIEARIDRLEREQKVGAALGTPKAPSPSASAKVAPGATVTEAHKSEPTASSAVPPLTIIKLKPKRESATPLSTAVQVEEPSADTVTELNAVAELKAEAAPEADSTDDAAEESFARGETMLKTGNLDGGVAVLKQFATDWPRHPKADNALYLAGLSLMATKDFEAAEQVLDSVTRKYPAGDALLDALLKVAECRMKMNRPEQAKAVYQQIVQSYPGTQAASFAQARLADRRSP